MKKFILFAMLLFATCLASAAVFVADSPPCVKHELSINDNYTNNVNVIEFLRNTKVPEVTLITYSMAVPTSLFNYQNIATSQTVTVPSVTENSRSGRVVPQTSSCFSVITIDMPDITNDVKIYILNRQLALK